MGVPPRSDPARRPGAGGALLQAALVGAALAFTPAAAAAQPASAIEWQDEWGRYDAVHLGVTLGLATTSLLVKLFLEVPPPGIDAALLFDDPLRDALRLPRAEQRRRARAISDWTLLTASLWPLVDALFVAGAGRRNGETAVQLLGVTAMSFSVTSLSMELAKPLVRRGRPFSRMCYVDGYDGGEECEHPDRYRSFFSGHAALSFTGASLVCSSHAHLPLYGGRGGGIAACASAMAVATTTALLRVLGDVHYASDVLTGAAIGFLAGFVLPSLLYYGFDGDGPPW